MRGASPRPGDRGAKPSGLPAGVSVGRVSEAELLRANLPPAPDARGDEKPEDQCHIVVSGPEPLLRELCGPRARDGGVTPGPHAGTANARHPALGGTLRALGYRANQVTWL